MDNIDTETISELALPTLDGEFELMLGKRLADNDEIKIYDAAVRSFINEIGYDGLPPVRKKRYNRELSGRLKVLGLTERYKKMQGNNGRISHDR